MCILSSEGALLWKVPHLLSFVDSTLPKTKAPGTLSTGEEETATLCLWKIFFAVPAGMTKTGIPSCTVCTSKSPFWAFFAAADMWSRFFTLKQQLAKKTGHQYTKVDVFRENSLRLWINLRRESVSSQSVSQCRQTEESLASVPAVGSYDITYDDVTPDGGRKRGNGVEK